MESLETIVKELEKGDLNLDDSVAKFEEGMKIKLNFKKVFVFNNQADGGRLI